MRTPLALAVAAAAAITVAIAPSAAADEHEGPGAIPPHPHVLIIGAEVDASGEVLLDYRRCVDVAANRTLPLGSQHEHVHFGRAGVALSGAGHAFVPANPAFNLPWTDCASFLAFFGFEETG